MKNLRDMAIKSLAELGTHTIDDVVREIYEGAKLSFINEGSWLVVDPIIYPQKRVAFVFLVVGEDAALDELYAAVLQWARGAGFHEVWGLGRPGWEKHADRFGFKVETKRALYRRTVQ